jgi:hypothetical protein
MIVTIKADSLSTARYAQFECFKSGLETEYMEGNIVQITSHNIASIQNLCARIGSNIKGRAEIIAVTDKTLTDRIGVA